MRIAPLAAAGLAASALALSAPAQAQEGMHPHPIMPSTISVSATSEISAAPEIATVSAGVVTEAPTASAAMNDNAKKMNAVMAQLKKAGIAEKAIQTSGLNLNPVYGNYVPNEAPKIQGYQASNTVSVRLEKLDRVGPAIDAIVAAGVNQINGVSFSIKDPDSKLDGARALAAKRAKAKAETMAQALGLKLGRVLSVSEGGGYSPPPMPMYRMAAQAADVAQTSIAPGEMELSASVSTTFELVE